MEKYKFTFNDKVYELGEDNCDYLANDEEHPVSGIEVSDMLDLLNQAEEVDFDVEYYEQPCPNCHAGVKEKRGGFKFLEYHFYIFTKNGEYVISSISKEYEGTSFNKLLRQGRVDNSYIASVIVCEGCGNYSIEISLCEV